ncbi:unnamed protein product [Parnassius apollo]|uniref:(apollo) hypothetical protein n=1 Tax=Parnassius apollo TaxID=110799 RepID=A0A8S3X6A5_PARAO|nr:unnamed protein product [Parnassius apollo]
MDLERYWVIEEKPPPCPYEIMSMVNDNQICTAHYTQYNNLSDLCPTLMNLNDLLATCHNPIETEWKITRKYNDHDAEKTLAVICGGRDSCRIFTSYTVLPDSILFRIINETNHVIYSRVMKNGQRNYVCVEDCGVLDNATKSVIKLEKPFILNLLDYASHKSKREDNTVTTKTVTTTEKKPKAENERKLLFLSKNMLYNKYLHKTVARNKKTIVKFITSNSTVNKVESITKTLCKKLEDSFRKDEDSDTKEDN